MSDIEKTDVTDRATAAGWTLPDGFRVLAWLDHDSDYGDPREKGDVYNTDVEEDDYDNPTHGFCKHCGAWTHKLDQAGADAVNKLHPADEDDEPVAVAGDWVVGAAGIKCPETGDVHELGEPLVVQWWREDRWAFVTVVVEVVDAAGREWGSDSLGAVEAGTFPVNIDRETGQVESKEIDPLTDPHHPLPDMLDAALHAARAELGKHTDIDPVIVPPPTEEPS